MPLIVSMASSIKLYPWQEKAVKQLKSGKILSGGVGSGKTFTSLVFVLRNYSVPLIVITTAKKRDTHDWQDDAKKVGLKDVTVDSWNNITKYKDLTNHFFIFDEQRVVGYGKWAKTFIKISKSNDWILLSATPGDTWTNYIPAFIANGFYRNKTDFINRHVEFDRFAKFPKIKAYHGTGVLQKHRHDILVPIEDHRVTERERITKKSKYDVKAYSKLQTRMNPFTNEPIENPSEFTQTARKIVSSSEDRQAIFENLVNKIDKVVVFYNYNYELGIILSILSDSGKDYAQWNGHIHEPCPTSDRWVYVVQYTAGAEAWETTDTDSIIFYSPNYSYKIMEQAEGRIDRINTPYHTLKYYYLLSNSPIDKAVMASVRKKKKFNESAWAKGVGHYTRE